MVSDSATIPAWNHDGLLPPIRRTDAGADFDRSPYSVGLTTLIDHFATSPERVKILNGLLGFRAKLHGAGIIEGFQWVDGSFTEQVELLESRPPRDVDVVTFFKVPGGEDQMSLMAKYGSLFDSSNVKTTFLVDSYFVVLGEKLDGNSVRRVSYWYSMWSHRRDGRWKGFVQIDLDPSQDADASALLNIDGGIRHD